MMDVMKDNTMKGTLVFLTLVFVWNCYASPLLSVRQVQTQNHKNPREISNSKGDNNNNPPNSIGYDVGYPLPAYSGYYSPYSAYPYPYAYVPEAPSRELTPSTGPSPLSPSTKNPSTKNTTSIPPTNSLPPQSPPYIADDNGLLTPEPYFDPTQIYSQDGNFGQVYLPDTASYAYPAYMMYPPTMPALQGDINNTAPTTSTTTTNSSMTMTPTSSDNHLPRPLSYLPSNITNGTTPNNFVNGSSTHIPSPILPPNIKKPSKDMKGEVESTSHHDFDVIPPSVNPVSVPVHTTPQAADKVNKNPLEIKPPDQTQPVLSSLPKKYKRLFKRQMMSPYAPVPGPYGYDPYASSMGPYSPQLAQGYGPPGPIYGGGPPMVPTAAGFPPSMPGIPGNIQGIPPQDSVGVSSTPPKEIAISSEPNNHGFKTQGSSSFHQGNVGSPNYNIPYNGQMSVW